MRVAVLGFMVAAVLVIAFVGACFQRSPIYAQPPANPRGERFPASEQLIAVAVDAAEGRQHVVLVDPKTRVMSVYHIDRTTGEIALKSVRNVHWDLLMEEFNGGHPSPREIRSLLEQR
jgi:hypothetical protein